jgi:hypothetical protein
MRWWVGIGRGICDCFDVVDRLVGGWMDGINDID